MDGVIFAQPKAPAWQFFEEWGNFASVVGLAITVGGFAWTWWRMRQLRLATRAEVRGAIQRIALQVLTTSVEDIHRLLMVARSTCLEGQWQKGHDACFEARLRVMRLAGNPHLNEEERDRLALGAGNLHLVLLYIENNKLNQESPPAVFQQARKEALDDMITLLTTIQGRLGNQAWGEYA